MSRQLMIYKTASVIRYIIHAAAFLCRNVVDFIYPPVCITCHNSLEPQASWLCLECEKKLYKNHSNRQPCPRCCINRLKQSCACDVVWDYYFEKSFALFDFDDILKTLAYEFKYNGKRSLARFLARKYATLIPSDFFNGVDAIVPVPLHFLRQMRRGYNQSQCLALGFSDAFGGSLPCLCNAVKRKRYTRTQTTLNKTQRQKNIKDAFYVPRCKVNLLKGKKIVLVDDIVTTASTTNECAAVLLEAGALGVKVLSLARD